jgi:phenylacetic acid degradation operon negative regulatory protein
MKQITCTDWIAHFLASAPPRSKSLVMTIFGDTIVPHGGTVWLGSLIELLAPLGVNDRLLRTSVFRLAQEGWLAASRDGRRSAYAIAPVARERFERANRRIYAPLATQWDGNWTLLLATGGAIDAPARAALRKELLWDGYALVAPGVYGHPLGSTESLADILARLALADKVVALRAAALPGVAARPLRALVDDGWDLSGVIALYRQFIAQFAPLAALLETASLSAQQAFVVRTLMIHEYRRVQLHDPMLPVDLLPDPWPGAAAYQLARTIYLATFKPAESFVLATLQSEDAAARAPGAAFFARFGGLD